MLARSVIGSLFEHVSRTRAARRPRDLRATLLQANVRKVLCVRRLISGDRRGNARRKLVATSRSVRDIGAADHLRELH